MLVSVTSIAIKNKEKQVPRIGSYKELKSVQAEVVVLREEAEKLLVAVNTKKADAKLIAIAKEKVERTITSRGRARSTYASMSLLQRSGYTAEEYDKMLEGTPLFGYGYIFSDAEKKHSVNGLFLAALTGREQSFGAAKTSLQKKFNLTSFNAPVGKTGNAYTFESYADCIDYTAEKLKENYLIEGGKYYSGNTISAVNKRYAQDKDWAFKIEVGMRELEKKLKK